MSVFKRILARFTGGSPDGHKQSSVEAAPSHAHNFRCALCEMTAGHRGAVYDHLKMFHKEVIDRNGHILEVDESPTT